MGAGRQSIAPRIARRIARRRIARRIARRRIARLQPKLRALREDVAVTRDERAAVVVEARAVAAALVGVEVDAARLRRRRAHQVEPLVELAQLVVRAAAVRDDLDAVERERNVRRVRREKFLAGLRADDGVGRRDRREAERARLLAADRADHPGQREVLDGAAARPLGEPARLAVVAVVAAAELRPDEHDLRVEEEDAAVVAHVAVDHRHPDVAQDAVRQLALQQRREALPAVQHRVLLEEVVLAAVAAHLELRPAAVPRARRLRLADRRLDPREVAREVERPLVEVARRHRVQLRVDLGLDLGLALLGEEGHGELSGGWAAAVEVGRPLRERG